MNLLIIEPEPRMRTSIIIASLIGSFLVFSASTDLFNSLFMLVLFGVVPGSNVPLPADQMLTIYALCASVIVAYCLRGGAHNLIRLLRINRTAS